MRCVARWERWQVAWAQGRREIQAWASGIVFTSRWKLRVSVKDGEDGSTWKVGRIAWPGTGWPVATAGEEVGSYCRVGLCARSPLSSSVASLW